MITLRPVGYGNLHELLALKVASGQESFVADNTYSLAEAFALRADGLPVQPFGLYAGEEPVGFAMFGSGWIEGDPEVARDHDVLVRFMIDARHQRKGHGKAALAACLDYLRQRPMGNAAGVWLSYEENNEAARRLYASAGFRENGERCGGEIVAVLAWPDDR